jgi:hypothetical protein
VPAVASSTENIPIRVTKLNAAQRQLRTAIRLWFADGDPIATHTLVSAAHEIIHRLFRNAGHSDLFWDSSIIKDERRADFARLMKAPAAFFKHAKHDPEMELNFHPGINETLIAYSITGLQRMGIALDVEESVFLHWFALHHPEWITKGSRYDGLDPQVLDDFRSIDKHQLFDAFALAWRQRRGA